MNKKGFSLIEMLAVVAILGILSTVAVSAVSRFQHNARQQAYDTLTESASLAAESYYLTHPNATEVSFETLIEEGYLENATDPGHSDANCDGKVVITTNGSGVASELKDNNYSVSVCCENYNYTYEYPNGIRHIDKYCKTLPYDITQIKDIKVLNVYPVKANGTAGNHLQGWMDTYGKGLIHVTPVSITAFNTNPEAYLGTNGNWKYDEIVFGFLDCNASQDLSVGASELVSNYLSSGGAAIFGHDTLTKGCGNHKNFNTLAKYVNMDLNPIHNPYPSGNKVKIIREGVFTKYPYEIGHLDTVLTIPSSHVYGQSANGDVWLTFNSPAFESALSADTVYLSTYGNNAFIQTGHLDGRATEDEQKIIANIIFYMVAKQYITDD